MAQHVSEEFCSPVREVHYDPTPIVFTGGYEEAAPCTGMVIKEGDAVLMQ